MLSIGLVSKNKNIELLKELNKNNLVQAFNIKEKEDIKDKKVDILVLEDLVLEKALIEEIAKEVSYLMIQDNITDIELNLNKEINVITFGFNHKSAVTVSSVTEENIVIYIQRTIRNIQNKCIQPQEIIIQNTNKYNINKYIIKKIIEEILKI